MIVTVCQMCEERQRFARDWESLVAHVIEMGSQLVLLPEMPFYAWLPRQRRFDEAAWNAAVAAHEIWLMRLAELASASVLGSRPVNREGERLNEAFAWDPQGGYRAAHHKHYLPDEEGFWEASWYQRGGGDFSPSQIGELRAGFLVCSELWFMQHARAYGQDGVHLIAVPRATPRASLDKWLAGGRAAAVISGAYCLSSNHFETGEEALGMGGQGWVVGPDGEVLGLTTAERPFVSVEIDLEAAEQAKSTYPRYIPD